MNLPIKGYVLAEHMAETIAAQYGLTLKEVRGSCKKTVYVACREEIAHMLKESLNLSTPEIGDVIHKDASSVWDMHQRYGKKSAVHNENR